MTENHNVPSSTLNLEISIFSFNSKNKNFNKYLRGLGTENFSNLDELEQSKSVTSELWYMFLSVTEK